MPAIAGPMDRPEEAQPLTSDIESGPVRASLDSVSSASTTSLVLEELNKESTSTNKNSYKLPRRGDSLRANGNYRDKEDGEGDADDVDLEDGPYSPPGGKPVSKKVRRIIWIAGALLTAGWVLALILFLSRKSFRHSSTIPHDPAATVSRGSGKQVTLEQVLTGAWRPQHHSISWIEGANDEDGLLLERGGGGGKDYLVVEDVRSRSKQDDVETHDSMTLMKKASFKVGSDTIQPADAWPSRSLENVLVVSDKEQVLFRRDLERTLIMGTNEISELATFIPRTLLDL